MVSKVSYFLGWVHEGKMETQVHVQNPSWHFVVHVLKYMSSKFGVDLPYGFPRMFLITA